eukprot:CAMPEP_0201281896 /NCGR_PEP_ID=MMETSP1317-20130820/4326_1 /ASSEMBLY_ACC=CAM_ASM_000770 /TAXON_ID=187299 /ORGANISM="Undescribed Undescribed, Strain Undescribed" /LENGTH=90 /DNA_ID=CAMNT_0047593069 /DNA_START=494 /DNA_END=766 /DNA_ORIENTATION=-
MAAGVAMQRETMPLDKYAHSVNDRKPLTYSYSEQPYLEALIKGEAKDYYQAKAKAGLVGPTSKIGGEHVDRAERALFAVLLCYTGLVEAF